MDIKELPSLDLLRKLVRCDFEAGEIYHLARTPDMFSGSKVSPVAACDSWNSRYAGKRINGFQRYNRVAIYGKYYKLHRVIYSIFHDIQLPGHVQIDHINGDPRDNRICNLRLADHSKQKQNSKKHKNNTSGHKGVSWHKRTKTWRAEIMFEGKAYHLGHFHDIEDAISARQTAEQKYFGEWSRNPEIVSD